MKNVKFLFLPVFCLLMAINFVSCDKDDDKGVNGGSQTPPQENNILTINGERCSFSYVDYQIAGDIFSFFLYNPTQDYNLIGYIEDWEELNDGDYIKQMIVSWRKNNQLYEAESYHQPNVIWNKTDKYVKITFKNATLEGDSGDIIKIDGVVYVNLK